MPPPSSQWLLFAAGALSYGVACLWSSSRSRDRDDEAVRQKEDELRRKDKQRRRRQRQRRRRRAAAARAAVAAAATAAAVVTTTMDQQQEPHHQNTYRPLRERVSACQARWVLEELAAAAATGADEDEDDGDEQARAGRHAARAVEMLAAGYGSGLGGEEAARWARVAWALQTGRRPAEADLVSAVAVGGGVARRRRPLAKSGDDDEDDRTDDALTDSHDETEPPHLSLFAA